MFDSAAIITVTELAEKMRVSDETIYRQVRNGQIPFKKIGRQIRFLGWQVNEWLTGRSNPA